MRTALVILKPDPQVENALTLKLEPKLMKPIALTDEPALTKLLTLRLEPMLVKSAMENAFPILPRDLTLILLPMFMKLQVLKLEPILLKLLIETLEPICVKLITLQEYNEPQLNTPVTERLDPHFINPLKLQLLAIVVKFNTEVCFPILQEDLKDRVDPRVKKSTILELDPNLANDLNDNALPRFTASNVDNVPESRT